MRCEDSIYLSTYLFIYAEATYVTLFFLESLFEVLEGDARHEGDDVPKDGQGVGYGLVGSFMGRSAVVYNKTKLQWWTENTQVI